LAALRCLLALSAVLSATAAAADPLDRWAPDIGRASSRFAIPADWIRRVMRLESGGRARVDGAPVVSPAGAMGLMQLMPGTWRDMRALLGLGADPFDPHDNILAGAAYLRLLYDRFGYPGLFAAYHAGPSRYGAYLSTGRKLPRETRAYVAAAAHPIGAQVGNAPAVRSSKGASPPLFVKAGAGPFGEDETERAIASPGQLFVQLTGAASTQP
jgi:soluble lytic murein transglycosylase-like protein